MGFFTFEFSVTFRTVIHFGCRIHKRRSCLPSLGWPCSWSINTDSWQLHVFYWVRQWCGQNIPVSWGTTISSWNEIMRLALDCQMYKYKCECYNPAHFYIFTGSSLLSASKRIQWRIISANSWKLFIFHWMWKWRNACPALPQGTSVLPKNKKLWLALDSQLYWK